MKYDVVEMKKMERREICHKEREMRLLGDAKKIKGQEGRKGQTKDRKRNINCLKLRKGR